MQTRRKSINPMYGEPELVSNLEYLMHRKRVNITQVAEATGISRQAISALKHNSPKAIRIATMTALCNYFGVTLNELFVFEGEDEIKAKKEDALLVPDN
ncbi:MAG: helix-turn-helix transcriptional regulator [Solibacillus isronensis]